MLLKHNALALVINNPCNTLHLQPQAAATIFEHSFRNPVTDPYHIETREDGLHYTGSFKLFDAIAMAVSDTASLDSSINVSGPDTYNPDPLLNRQAGNYQNLSIGAIVGIRVIAGAYDTDTNWYDDLAQPLDPDVSAEAFKHWVNELSTLFLNEQFAALFGEFQQISAEKQAELRNTTDLKAIDFILGHTLAQTPVLEALVERKRRQTLANAVNDDPETYSHKEASLDMYRRGFGIASFVYLLPRIEALQVAAKD